MFELKRLSTAAIPAALAKAERYRLLNEPEEAQSICEDILTADPDEFRCGADVDPGADRYLPKQDGNVSRAQELVARLPSEYERAYFGGTGVPSAAPARCWRAAARAARCRPAI